MRTIAHISDLHFGRIDGRVVDGLLAELHTEAASLTVISGDLVQRPARSQFRAARAFLDQLPGPYLVVPGNHDIPVFNLVARFTDPFRRYRHYVSEELAPVYTDTELAVLGINTARSWVLNFAHGRVSRHQIEHVHRVFERLPATLFRILVAHHPVLGPPDWPRAPLVGQLSRALPGLAACGVEMVLGGHLHRAFTGDLLHHHAHVERSILVVQAGTATSTRLRREPNGFNRITIDRHTVEVVPRLWDGSGFVSGTKDRFVRRGVTWHRTDADASDQRPDDLAPAPALA